MFGLDTLESLFVIFAFLFQIVLIVHFALRKWRFDSYIMQYGWLVYALCGPAVVLSVLLISAGKTWSLWLGGWLFLIWAIFGYVVEYVKKVKWRNPIHGRIFGPYVTMYLATVMFYWWPLALLYRPLWYAYAVLFVISMVLNLMSH